jgi:hypothetical protein
MENTMTRNQVAASVAANKRAHPEKYCPKPNCLWRTGNGLHCPRHTTLADLQREDAIDEAREVLAEQERHGNE